MDRRFDVADRQGATRSYGSQTEEAAREEEQRQTVLAIALQVQLGRRTPVEAGDALAMLGLTATAREMREALRSNLTAATPVPGPSPQTGIDRQTDAAGATSNRQGSATPGDTA